MNEAMNDHIAQFVKGAHILTAAAVVTIVVAAVPTSVMLSRLPASPDQTSIVGPVDGYSPDLTAVRGDIANLKKDIGTLSNSKAAEGELKRLEEKVAQLEAKLREMQKAMPVRPGKKGDVAPAARP